MSTKQSDLSAFGKAQTEGMLNLQKELLETYEQASRAWLDRVRSEVELWSRLGAKLTATRSVPEAMEAYQKCVGERMQMAAEDGKRLFDECQNITQKIAGSLNGGRWPGRTGDEWGARVEKCAAPVYFVSRLRDDVGARGFLCGRRGPPNTASQPLGRAD